jgi:GxxExxY protein
VPDNAQFKHGNVTGIVRDAFFAVYNMLGYGFLEKVYTRAMELELTRRGIHVQRECPIPVYYLGQKVGEYYADLVVADCVIVELKAAEALAEEHEAQLLNYLKATRYEVGMLLNFGPAPEIKRRVMDNLNKGSMRWLSEAESTQQ